MELSASACWRAPTEVFRKLVAWSACTVLGGARALRAGREAREHLRTTWSLPRRSGCVLLCRVAPPHDGLYREPARRPTRQPGYVLATVVPRTYVSPLHADPSAESLALSRRDFIASATALGLCLAGCRSWTPDTRAAYALVTDPPPGFYRPVLRGIVRAVLPFEHPQFPALTPSDIEKRLVRLFPVDRESRFLTLQRSLAMFDQVDLFPHAFAPIVAAEHTDPEEPQDSRSDSIALGTRADEQRYAAFLREWRPKRLAFSELPVGAQRAYLAMWMRSSFIVRRQFARSAKSMVTITAYSMDTMWRVIGYRGPLLEEGRAPS